MLMLTGVRVFIQYTEICFDFRCRLTIEVAASCEG